VGKARVLLIYAGFALLLLPFQNCGTGFKSAQLDQRSDLQCKGAMKAEALRQSWSAAELDCGNLANYECERRIFSPDLATMSHQLKECLPGDKTCVDVNVFQFNTQAARKASQNQKDFEPGGSYNHEEIRCQHRFAYRGTRVFEAQRDSLEESLAAAMKACERATDKSSEKQ
jgi:hypothetical protein